MMSRDPTTDDLDAVRRALPDLGLGVGEQLVSGERSSVWRVGSRTGSLVVKRFRSAGEGWVRECAALESLPPGAPAPRLVAACAEPPVLVSSDAGGGPSVAEALLGTEPGVASDAVLSWARALGALHGHGHGVREQFGGSLRARAGDLPVAEHELTTWFDAAIGTLEQHCDSLAVAVPAHALHDLRELPRSLRDDDACALSPADTCPDNNVRTDDGVVLVDFEGAEWRHTAWDVAYLTVPWPTCWCAWRLPGDLAERAVEVYRQTAEEQLPYVRTDRFRADVATAAVGWAMVSSAWFLRNALAGDPPSPDPARRQPARQAMILHRLDLARRTSTIASIAELAVRLREVLAQRWGETSLRVAPAFDTDV